MRDTIVNKQSQFPAAGIPHYCTVLSFHHSDPVPTVPNKPNLGQPGRHPGSDYAKQSQFPRRAWGGAVGQSCETKPIRDKSGEAAQPTKRRLCEKEPNLGESGYLGDRTEGGRAQGKCAKQTQFPAGRQPRTIPIFHDSTVPVRCVSCETKPIPATASGGAKAWRERSYGEYYMRQASAKQSQSGGAAHRAKQSQFPASQALGNIQLCETKPISRLRISDCGWRIQDSLAAGRPLRTAEPRPVVQTNPIWPGGIPHHSTIPLFHRSSSMPIVQNKPNSGVRGPICRRTRRCLRRSRSGSTGGSACSSPSR
jgi:hypothetical protein